MSDLNSLSQQLEAVKAERDDLLGECDSLRDRAIERTVRAQSAEASLAEAIRAIDEIDTAVKTNVAMASAAMIPKIIRRVRQALSKTTPDTSEGHSPAGAESMSRGTLPPRSGTPGPGGGG